jgi:soluble lytic murein transglycosylase-like protein
MTVVFVVSTGIVTGEALDGGSPSAAVTVCPGAAAENAAENAASGTVTTVSAATAASAGTGATGATSTTAASAATATTVGVGVLPPELIGQPARLRLVPVFRRWASICGLPVALVEATCWWESGWQEGVVSVTGAVGVCQIEPGAAETVRGLLDDKSLDPRSSSENIEMSAAYLRWLLDETGGSRELTLASYYQGLTSVREHGILAVSRPYVAGITALLNDYSWS